MLLQRYRFAARIHSKVLANQVDIEIAEISRGSALADEISNLLQP